MLPNDEQFPDLAVVIVNYRTPDLTIACLRSLAAEAGDFASMRVVVTDNASGDDSVERIEAAIKSNDWRWAKLVPLPRNGGFAYGNNRGIEHCRDARYVLLLNSDTIVHRGALRKCWDRMESDRGIGAMSCLLRNGDGSMQNAARLFPNPARLAVEALGLPWIVPGLFGSGDLEDAGWDRLSVARNVDWIGGAFMFVRGAVMRKIGGLDETFFFYGEDVAFCHRVWRLGYRCFYDPAGSITHLGGASSDPTRVAAKQRNLYHWKARYVLQEKCYGPAAAWMVRGMDLLACGMRLFKMRVTRRQSSPRYAVTRDVLELLSRPLRVAPPGKS
jgi:GT2 family glycosyltransferase